MRKISLACALVFLLLGTAWAADPPTGDADNNEPEGISVVAEGYSYLGDDASIKEARTKAMAEAERSALEQGVPIYLESYTEVENYQVNTDKIKSKLKGYIKNKKVLIDELDKDELKYKIKIEAIVVYSGDKKEALPGPEDALRETDPNTVPEWKPMNDFFRVSRCQKDPETLKRLWLQVERTADNNPRKFIVLLEMLYPIVAPDKLIRHLLIVRSHKPIVYEHVMRQLLPRKKKIPALKLPAVREMVFFRLKRLRKEAPRKYINLVRRTIPRLDPKEFKRRVLRICRNQPRIFEQLKDLLLK